MAYERYRDAKLETSPWQDYLIALQVRSCATLWRRAEKEAEGSGYRNDHTRGYWPDGPRPDDLIEERIEETKGWRRRQMRYSRIVRYLLPMIEAKLEGWHHAVLWDGLVGCLVETVSWWFDSKGELPRPNDFDRDDRLPPSEVLRTVPDGLDYLNERALVLDRGDPPVVLR